MESLSPSITHDQSVPHFRVHPVGRRGTTPIPLVSRKIGRKSLFPERRGGAIGWPRVRALMMMSVNPSQIRGGGGEPFRLRTFSGTRKRWVRGRRGGMPIFSSPACLLHHELFVLQAFLLVFRFFRSLFLCDACVDRLRRETYVVDTRKRDSRREREKRIDEFLKRSNIPSELEFRWN